MDEKTREDLRGMYAQDREAQTKSYHALLAATEQPVDWVYDVWDELVGALRHPDNHVRSIAAQLLSNLAKSDPEMRMLKDFDALIAVTKDERFVTARHCLQSLWKIGLAGEQQRERLLEGLARRYQESIEEKNGTLIRYDILQGMRNLYDALGADHPASGAIREKALEMIEIEEDLKYHKKYANVWKGTGGT